VSDLSKGDNFGINQFGTVNFYDNMQHSIAVKYVPAFLKWRNSFKWCVLNLEFFKAENRLNLLNIRIWILVIEKLYESVMSVYIFNFIINIDDLSISVLS